MAVSACAAERLLWNKSAECFKARQVTCVSGFGFRVSDFGFQVSGFGFRVSGFGFRV